MANSQSAENMFVAIMVIVCGRHGNCLWPSWSWFVAVMVIVCGRHGHCLWPSWQLFVAVMVIVCGRHGNCLWPSWSWFVAIIVEPQHTDLRHMCTPAWILWHYSYWQSILCMLTLLNLPYSRLNALARITVLRQFHFHDCRSRFSNGLCHGRDCQHQEEADVALHNLLLHCPTISFLAFLSDGCHVCVREVTCGDISGCPSEQHDRNTTGGVSSPHRRCPCRVPGLSSCLCYACGPF